MKDIPKKRIEKPAIFGNWIDQYGYPITSRILPYVTPFRFITPNFVTLTAFSLYVFGCISLFLDYPYHLLVAAVALPVAYIGDQLDGQVARSKNLSSHIGDYLDKVLDVLKIYIIMGSLGVATYSRTENVIYPFLALTACFFFNFRYYIKLETVLKQADLDPEYLKKCSQLQPKFEEEILERYERLRQGSVKDKLNAWWIKNKSVIFVDEGEFAVFAGLAALFNHLELVLGFFALSQFLIATYRLFERGYQVHTQSIQLLKPLRK